MARHTLSSVHRATRADAYVRSLQRAPRDVAILIPAHRPPAALEFLVDGLLEAGAPAILLVDDGSPQADRARFDRIARSPRVHVLRHDANLGKGCALKTGVAYFLAHLSHYAGLVTADADGQHAADDVLRVARALHNSPRLVILGARSLRSNLDAPLRSRAGNRLMTALFRLMTRIPVSDTQTGLRAFPTGLLPILAQIPGLRYEYEIAVLRFIVRIGHPLAEQSIRTVFDEGNTQSDFRPIVDSLRVLGALLRQPKYVRAIARDRAASPVSGTVATKN